MSDTRLIRRVARFLEPEATEDLEEAEDMEEAAKRIIAIVRKSDRRKNPPRACDICGKLADARPAFCKEHAK